MGAGTPSQPPLLSLAELNVAIRECVQDLNNVLMRRLGKSRRELFETLDRPALIALPEHPYAYAEWKKCRVAPDYHVDIAGHYYSVPSRLIGEMVDARLTGTTVEILHKGMRVASHVRSYLKNRHTTIAEHMPRAHRRYAFWTPARLKEAKIGPSAIALRRSDHERQAASRAGLPLMSRHSAVGQELWATTSRSRVPAR